jgi:TRAP-type mannitol/chloroaromatic compound transport system permease small subunit
MEKAFRVVDQASVWTGKLASYLMAALVVAICYDVFLRYAMNKPTHWAFELTYMVYGAYAMLGVAYCQVMKTHVRMDLLYARLPPRARAWTDVVCYLCLFFPLLIVLTYKCGEHGLWAFTSGERSSSSVWRPALWPFKLAITFGFALFLLQGFVDFLRTLLIAIRGGSHES